MPSEQVTVTISGPTGFRKSQIAEIIQDALLEHGCPVTPDPAHGQITPRAHRCRTVTTWSGEGVRIVECATVKEPWPAQVQTSNKQWRCVCPHCRGC